MADPYEPYLRQAEELFEAGDIVKAGQIWQAVLKRDPKNPEARSGLYKVKAHFDTRATQGGLVLETAAPEAQIRLTLTPPSPEGNSLLEAGCALYDAGLPAKAISAWEAALRQDPNNALARGYIDLARRKLEADAAGPPGPGPASSGPIQVPPAPEPPAPEPPAPAPSEEDEIEKCLRDGCTLFDMGQVEDALGKWERVLAHNPNHALALAYLNDARKELGLPALAPGEVPAPAPAAPVPVEAAPVPVRGEGDLSKADQLVREGVQLYDMGMAEEAEEKWRQALELEPGNGDAPGYLAMASRDRLEAPPSKPAPARAPTASGSMRPVIIPQTASNLEARLSSAENLLRNNKFEEAAFIFQCLLDTGSQDPRILQGYQQARALHNAQEEAPAEPAPLPPPPPLPVDPPRVVTVRPPARSGLKIPALRTSLPARFRKPRTLALAAGGFLVLALGLTLLVSHRRDVALKEAITAAKANAMAPMARKARVVDLSESSQAIRKEAETALADDPLTAYYRAQECLRLDPNDAACAQLLAKARARMTETASSGSPDPDRSMKNGDLESARAALLDLLRKLPDDAQLKGKARTVFLALVQTRATNEQFPEARELLLQGRAMFPQDKTWAARLKLLEEIQGLPKAERPRWIPLLG